MIYLALSYLTLYGNNKNSSDCYLFQSLCGLFCVGKQFLSLLRQREFLWSSCTAAVVPRMGTGWPHLSSHLEANYTMFSSVVVLVFVVQKTAVFWSESKLAWTLRDMKFLLQLQCLHISSGQNPGFDEYQCDWYHPLLLKLYFCRTESISLISSSPMKLLEGWSGNHDMYPGLLIPASHQKRTPGWRLCCVSSNWTSGGSTSASLHLYSFPVTLFDPSSVSLLGSLLLCSSGQHFHQIQQLHVSFCSSLYFSLLFHAAFLPVSLLDPLLPHCCYQSFFI